MKDKQLYYNYYIKLMKINENKVILIFSSTVM